MPTTCTQKTTQLLNSYSAQATEAESRVMELLRHPHLASSAPEHDHLFFELSQTFADWLSLTVYHYQCIFPVLLLAESAVDLQSDGSLRIVVLLDLELANELSKLYDSMPETLRKQHPTNAAVRIELAADSTSLSLVEVGLAKTLVAGAKGQSLIKTCNYLLCEAGHKQVSDEARAMQALKVPANTTQH